MPAVDAVIVAAIVAAFVTFAGQGPRAGPRPETVNARLGRFLFVPVVCRLLIMQA
jgi:hypothetical protein